MQRLDRALQLSARGGCCAEAVADDAGGEHRRNHKQAGDQQPVGVRLDEESRPPWAAHLAHRWRADAAPRKLSEVSPGYAA